MDMDMSLGIGMDLDRNNDMVTDTGVDFDKEIDSGLNLDVETGMALDKDYDMLIIGVTGGIGSGKSSVSSILKELGARVLDADAITRQVVEPGKPAWHEIVSSFGSDILNPDKTIDRKKLAGIVIKSGTEKKKLEAIIHHKVLTAMKWQIDILKKEGYKGVVALDVPIPVKDGFLNIVDQVWVVTSDYEERIRRIMKRSGFSREEAKIRIASQLSQDEYVRLADVVIKNDKDFNELRNKVERLYNDSNDKLV